MVLVTEDGNRSGASGHLGDRGPGYTSFFLLVTNLRAIQIIKAQGNKILIYVSGKEL